MLYDSVQIFEGSKITNLVVNSGSSFPTSPSAPADTGELFFNTSTSKLYVYDGSGWTAMDGGGGSSALVAGTGISIASSIVSNTGVLSLTGTSNQVSVSQNSGNITLSLASVLNVDISGNAATATSAGAATSATTATSATNLLNGTTGNLVYQTNANQTSFVSNGSSGQVLTSAGNAVPTWQNRVRSATITSSNTITPNGAVEHYTVTALASGSVTIAPPSGSPYDGQKLTLRMKDTGSARALTWTTTAGGYRAVGVTLPTTTIAGKVLYMGFIYNSQDGYWDAVSTAQQA